MRTTNVDGVDYFYGKKLEKSDDLLVIFTNDIHCAIDEGITMAGVASLKKRLEKYCKNVILVDCGDAIQGSFLGTVSKGEIVVDVMNEIGYDMCIFGNHEFDYGIPRLLELVKKSNAQYLNCNIKYTGNETWENEKDEEEFRKKVKPYIIKEISGHKIGFVGIATPVTLSTSTPSNFKRDGIFVFDFAGSEDGHELYETVQKTVDDCRTNGAEFIIALAHLGLTDTDAHADPNSSINLIKNTNGIDILLDGHSHSTYSSYCIENKDGELITIAQTGTKLSSVGIAMVTYGGLMSASLVGDYPYRDEDVKNKVDGIIEKYKVSLGKVIGHTDYDILTTDQNGVRLVRNRETTMGNLVSDSFRIITGSDISYINGGGIRADLKKGDVTYLDSISINPFGNMLCVIEVTGQDILDMIEYFVKEVQKDYTDSTGLAIGEHGGFPQMSGIKFTVNTAIASTVKTDLNDNLLSIGDVRRVSDVQVLENDKYVPIDPNKTYTLSTNDFVAKNGGIGMDIFLKNHKVVLDSIISDYECLVNYITNVLNGDLSKYKEVDGRIKFIHE